MRLDPPSPSLRAVGYALEAGLYARLSLRAVELSEPEADLEVLRAGSGLLLVERPLGEAGSREASGVAGRARRLQGKLKDTAFMLADCLAKERLFRSAP
jgi:hypothetical protein